MEDIKLKKGKIKIDNSLTILDNIKTNNYLVKIMLIITTLSLLFNGYYLYINFSKYLLLVSLTIFVWLLITLYLLFVRSYDIKVYFDEIKKISLKKVWLKKSVIQLDLTNGKRRLISNFKNVEDSERLFYFVEDKINSKV